MKDNAQAMVLAAFAADALALGAHWIYDPGRIKRQWGRLETFQAPLKDSFHATKTRGDLTHYGDQTLLLLRFLAEQGTFDAPGFLEAWRKMFSDYTGYRDQATRTTLKNLEKGADFRSAGAPSSDLGGASRIAPLVYFYAHDPDRLRESARAQTLVTHNHPLVIESAAFFADTAARILEGMPPVDAMNAARKTLSLQRPLGDWLQKGLESVSDNTREALAAFGLPCDIQGAFPGVIHLVAKYEKDLKGALVENVMAGGDSAARGLVTGMLLGAYLGEKALPEAWISELKCRETVLSLLAEINAKKAP